MSELIDISKHIPKGTDKYFVDSNVWFWFTYAASNEIENALAPKRYQIDKYPNYIEKILDEGARLYHSPLTLSELSNIIERTEYEIYLLDNPKKNLNRKEFRKLPESRARVMAEIDSAWATIGQISECLDILLNSNLAINALKILKESQLDPYDAYYLDSMSTYGVENILTDDGDFIGTNTNVYTANSQVRR